MWRGWAWKLSPPARRPELAPEQTTQRSHIGVTLIPAPTGRRGCSSSSQVGCAAAPLTGAGPAQSCDKVSMVWDVERVSFSAIGELGSWVASTKRVEWCRVLPTPLFSPPLFFPTLSLSVLLLFPPRFLPSISNPLLSNSLSHVANCPSLS